MTHHTLGSTVAALGTVALVGLGTLSSPATADVAAGAGADKPVRTRAVAQTGPVPGGFASWQDLLAVQHRLVKAADRVTAAAQGADSGFAGVVTAPETRRLQLFWKGRPPRAVSAVLADIGRDVPVSVRPAKHSTGELAREAKRLVTAPGGGQISSIAPEADGSGLTATVTGKARATALGLLAASRVPVAVEKAETPALASRWNDSPPWYGGAAWRNATRGGGCSTGFAVNHGGRTKMLTAGHCGSLGDRATDPTGQHMGYLTQDSNALDVALIDARSAGRIFNNTPPSLTEFTNPVLGPSGSYTGMYVWTSGAYSGTRGPIQVKQTGVTINIGYLLYNQVRAEKVDRTSAIGQGDSGGPVQVVANPSTSVYVAGVNSAIDTSTAVPCTGYVRTGRTCAWRMYYAPWSSVQRAFGTATSVVKG